ncbi:hypothetical protein PGT21_034886 [Puccinia graminis f. sp. tritici]|uniref:Uncharacterized protein n=1 Tax=Puccinia graminis f. sp. tritici TaxID=56615 RepID=A0A5B0PZR6_PUCGR|nr:hypothetical protein PGT21_034886 [Puccinia graminis f. sp. tritici]KAA1126381.1 hypothetical protein PGTUg99_030013 [Puccinia graminis f. sp. tritici]
MWNPRVWLVCALSMWFTGTTSTFRSEPQPEICVFCGRDAVIRQCNDITHMETLISVTKTCENLPAGGCNKKIYFHQYICGKCGNYAWINNEPCPNHEHIQVLRSPTDYADPLGAA